MFGWSDKILGHRRESLQIIVNLTTVFNHHLINGHTSASKFDALIVTNQPLSVGVSIANDFYISCLQTN